MTSGRNWTDLWLFDLSQSVAGENAGHDLLQECPDEVLPPIIRFLSQTRDDTRASPPGTGHAHSSHPTAELCV